MSGSEEWYEVSVAPVIQLLEVAPCFQTVDLSAAVEYYRDKLGFVADPAGTGVDNQTVVSRDGIALVLAQADGRRPARSTMDTTPDVIVWVTDLDSLAVEFRFRGAHLLEPLAGSTPDPTGMLYVRDLDGHVIAFASSPL